MAIVFTPKELVIVRQSVRYILNHPEAIGLTSLIEIGIASRALEKVQKEGEKKRIFA
jgi:hypothetical protein